MHTIVIQSDTLKQDDEFVENLKKLFPDCKVKIVNKSLEKSKNRHIPFNEKRSSLHE
jgi:hypothetical protein